MKHKISYLFLRGLSRNQFHWNKKNEYSKILENEVHFLDLPGFGLNSNLESPISIQEIQKNVAEQWSQLSINPDSKRVLVGLSLGGQVALDWVGQIHQPWHGVVLINSSVSSFSWPWERFKFKNVFSFLKYTISFDPIKFEKTVFNVSSLSKKESLLQEWLEVAKKYPFKSKDVIYQLYAAAKFKAPSKVNNCKGLVLYSENDQLVSNECSKKIAKNYKFEIKEIKNCGHDAATDQIEVLLHHIKEFANSL